jgi:hypothetical protein
MSDAGFDVAKAQRWFAVEFNNRAWDLLEKVNRSAAETEEMLHAAHAACLHWLAIGKPINHTRALYLLASAYAAAGFGELAVRHALLSIESCDAAGEETTAFDRAMAFGCASNAHAVLAKCSRRGTSIGVRRTSRRQWIQRIEPCLRKHIRRCPSSTGTSYQY